MKIDVLKFVMHGKRYGKVLSQTLIQQYVTVVVVRVKERYPCNIFPAEPTQEETIQKIEVERQWTWEDEKLMEAYACKKNIDEFRRNRQIKKRY